MEDLCGSVCTAGSVCAICQTFVQNWSIAPPPPSRLSRAQYKAAAEPYFRPRSYSTNAP